MIGQPSHLLLRLVAGSSPQHSRTLPWGSNVPPFSVGQRGDWTISAPGVMDAHLYLAFDGARLCVAAVSPRNEVKVHGAPLPATWSELALPAELQFGGARVQARALFSAPETLAVTKQLELGSLAPLLLAARPVAGRSPAARPSAAPLSAHPAQLETACDGGALRAHALRLMAQTATAARLAPQPEPQPGLEPARGRPPAQAELADLAAQRRSAHEPLAAPRRSVLLAIGDGARWRQIDRQLRAALAQLRTALAQRASAVRQWLRRVRATLRQPGPLSAPWRAPGARQRARQSAIIALASCAAIVLVWRSTRSVSAAASAPARDAASAAEAPRQPSAPATATVPTSDAAATREPAAAPLDAHVDAPVEPSPAPAPELPPPASPELQRAAFRAALSGDESAAGLYQRLASGPDARVFQLAARFAARGHVRKP